jgi:hypothetical protein
LPKSGCDKQLLGWGLVEQTKHCRKRMTFTERYRLTVKVNNVFLQVRRAMQKGVFYLVL